ncbi:hypothetical protein EJ07DRAFT_166441 [Lizonia empirigonia]|nr:hypothetical protein EJ07DRAFT_166441 [Lizonia empirigonia]
MKLSILSLIALTGFASASPVTLDARADGYSYAVSGLGIRKQAILNVRPGARPGLTLNAGGSTLELAIAMLETDHMDTNYQNWGMLRECASVFKGQSTADWNNGVMLNSDLNVDVTARVECQNYYGYDKWFAITGVQWLQQQIDSDPKYQSDDTRFIYYVVGI